MTSHAEYSPSAAKRWLACPGAVPLAATLPEQKAGFAANEGTAAHRLAELAINDHDYKSRWALGESIEGIDVTEEMLEATRVYIDFIFGLELNLADELYIEKRVQIKSIPATELFGTADCLVISSSGFDKELWVVDYKHGKYPVEAFENPQLVIYALGALETLRRRGEKFSRYHLCIVQPRAPHIDAPIRIWTLDTSDLLKWERKIKKAIKESIDNPGKYVEGPHCRFCAGERGECPAKYEKTQQRTKLDFAIGD